MRRKDREITDRKSIAEILRAADTCHLSFLDGEYPYIVALNFGLDWTDESDGSLPTLYFHCAREGKKLDLAAKNPHAAFFVDTGHELVSGDRACDWGMRYRSVAGRGIVRTVENSQERIRALDAIMMQYTGKTGFEYDPAVFAATTILALGIESISAKQKA